jgi:hypothetical protein
MKSNLAAFLVITAIAVYILFPKHNSYIGFFYPDRNDLLEYKESIIFSSLEGCRDWALDQPQIWHVTREDSDYECGKNCKIDSNGPPYTCDETLK